MYDIQWAVKAVRQLEKIKDVSFRREIRDAVESLKDFPKCRNVKVLVNHAYTYRLRKNNWRIFFNADGALKRIFIEEVKKRDGNTY